MEGKESKSGSNTDTLLKALTHETRRRIMKLCINRNGSPVSPIEISTELRETLNHISYHVRVLAEYKAVTLVGTTPVRGSMQHFYLPSTEVIGMPWVHTVLDSAGEAA
jgi:predicted transcriptional regulator